MVETKMRTTLIILFFSLLGVNGQFRNGTQVNGTFVGTPLPPTDISTTGLILKYVFDNGSGTTVSDMSMSGNNGTLSGDYAWTTSNGPHGAVNFNPNNLVGRLQYSAAVGGNTFTLSAWVNITAAATYGTLIDAPGSFVGLF